MGVTDEYGCTQKYMKRKEHKYEKNNQENYHNNNQNYRNSSIYNDLCISVWQYKGKCGETYTRTNIRINH